MYVLKSLRSLVKLLCLFDRRLMVSESLDVDEYRFSSSSRDQCMKQNVRAKN